MTSFGAVRLQQCIIQILATDLKQGHHVRTRDFNIQSVECSTLCSSHTHAEYRDLQQEPEVLSIMSSFQQQPAGGDQNLGPTINAVCWLFTTLATLAVGARIYGRARLTHNLGWDDFWIVVAMVRLSNFLVLHSVRMRLTKTIAEFEYPLRSNVFCKCRRRNWKTSILPRPTKDVAGHQVEQHSICAGHGVPRSTKSGGRLSPRTTSEPEEQSEMA